MYKIYIVINSVNGKVYVGMTSKSVDARWKGHISGSRAENPSQHITRAIRKYGPEVFVVREIDSCESRQLACLLESAYICLYMSTDPDIGYNCTFGGDGVVATPEVREKIGRSHRGKFGIFKHTEDAKRRIGLAFAGKPKPVGFGEKVSAAKRENPKRYSAEECQDRSVRMKGKVPPNKRMDVSDEEVGALFKQGWSLTRIGRHFNISSNTVGRRLRKLGLLNKYGKKPKWWMQTN